MLIYQYGKNVLYSICIIDSTKNKIGRLKKNSITHPQRKFPLFKEGVDRLKNILNSYRMSKEGGMGIVKIPRGIFSEATPIT